MKTKSTGLAIGVLATALALSALWTGRAQTGATNSPDVFQFPGGNPRQLLEQVEKEFKVDWLSVADIPREMDHVRVPQFRIDFKTPDAVQGQPPRTSLPLEVRLMRLIAFYNRMAQEKPELGKLFVDPEPIMSVKPSVVLLVPDKNSPTAKPEMKVKAFALRGLPKTQWNEVVKDVMEAEDDTRQFNAEMQARYGGRPDIQGSVRIHESTSLLVASGSESYVEMVESIVAAHRTNRLGVIPGPAPAGEPLK